MHMSHGKRYFQSDVSNLRYTPTFSTLFFFWGGDSIGHFNSLQFSLEKTTWYGLSVNFLQQALSFELIPTQVINSGEATERPQSGAWLVEMYY